MKLKFTHQGVERTLAKHPKVVQQLKKAQITAAAAKAKPWYLRVKIADRPRVFKLNVGDKQAIASAKTILTGRVKQPDSFTQFLALRDLRRGCTVGELAKAWATAGLPFTTSQPRKPAAADRLAGKLARALRWWEDKRWNSISQHQMQEFVVWRRQTVDHHQKAATGSRSADLELTALSCLGNWAKASGRVDANPFGDRQRFASQEAINHCHEGMSDDDQQFHTVLGFMFQDPADKGWVVAGAWLAFMALTGLRPGEYEALQRVPASDRFPANFDAAPCGLVYPSPDGIRRMKVARLKNGQNPAVLVHSALADFLQHYNVWLDKYFPRTDTAPAPLFPELNSLGWYLNKAGQHLQIKKMKPHGFGRAYYVRVRRSLGIDDATIACELGQRTDGALIRSVYGHPKDPVGGMLHDWLPANPDGTAMPAAWQKLISAERAAPTPPAPPVASH